MHEPIRLNKYLVQKGICSRREADRLIEQGKITVNGKKAVMGQKVVDADSVAVLGKGVTKTNPKPVYLAYNKPVGIICTSDPDAHDTIIEAVNYPERVFHIGRLDVASSGLILLTNQGDIVNKILRAGEEHEKEYIVQIDRPVTDYFLEQMGKGVMVLGRKTLPAKVERLDERTFSITLIEGRNRQIRRMCEALGASVRSLQRIRIMHITLGRLSVGQWRKLSLIEEQKLLQAIQ